MQNVTHFSDQNCKKMGKKERKKERKKKETAIYKTVPFPFEIGLKGPEKKILL